MKDSSHEREQLRRFVLTILDELRIPIREQALAPLQTAASIRGLREATRDMVEMCEALSADQVASLDARLARSGLPTLFLMRDGRYRDFLRVLTRGQINSAEEFRLVNSYVSDVDSPHLSPEVRSSAGVLLAAFESEG